MRYASVCSGVESPSLAWRPLGWEPVFFSEIAKFPAELLRQRYPETPNLGDMTKINGENYRGKIDLLTGGTPCQSFSVAGKRGGLADRRGSLAIVFAELAHRSEVEWIVWENVPGVLSSADGRDFAGLLSALAGWRVPPPKSGKWKKSGLVNSAGGGYSLAWRLLDAQFVRVDGFERAVPQRRRRLFLVGHRSSASASAQVLFDDASMQFDAQPVRTPRPQTAGVAAGGTPQPDPAEWWNGSKVASTLTVTSARQSMPDEGKLQAVITRCCCPNDACAEAEPEIASTLRVAVEHAVAIAANTIGRKPENGGNGSGVSDELCYTLTASDRHAVASAGIVRRLTPIECERLMGFPDNYTLIEWRGKSADQCPDGPRYEVCGNSQCVNVMRWIGRRIEMVSKMM